MVRIRLSRTGRPHLAIYRINAVEKRVKRDGRVLENLGWYAPSAKDASKRVHMNIERIKHWLAMGAQPSDTLKDMFAAQNLIDANEWKAVRTARAKAKEADVAMKLANPQPDPKKKKAEEKKK